MVMWCVLSHCIPKTRDAPCPQGVSHALSCACFVESPCIRSCCHTSYSRPTNQARPRLHTTFTMHVVFCCLLHIACTSATIHSQTSAWHAWPCVHATCCMLLACMDIRWHTSSLDEVVAHVFDVVVYRAATIQDETVAPNGQAWCSRMIRGSHAHAHTTR